MHSTSDPSSSLSFSEFNSSHLHPTLLPAHWFDFVSCPPSLSSNPSCPSPSCSSACFPYSLYSPYSLCLPPHYHCFLRCISPSMKRWESRCIRRQRIVLLTRMCFACCAGGCISARGGRVQSSGGRDQWDSWSRDVYMVIRGSSSLEFERKATDVSVFDDNLRNNAIGAEFVE